MNELPVGMSSLTDPESQQRFFTQVFRLNDDAWQRNFTVRSIGAGVGRLEIRKPRNSAVPTLNCRLLDCCRVNNIVQTVTLFGHAKPVSAPGG